LIQIYFTFRTYNILIAPLIAPFHTLEIYIYNLTVAFHSYKSIIVCARNYLVRFSDPLPMTSIRSQAGNLSRNYLIIS